MASRKDADKKLLKTAYRVNGLLEDITFELEKDICTVSKKSDAVIVGPWPSVEEREAARQRREARAKLVDEIDRLLTEHLEKWPLRR